MVQTKSISAADSWRPRPLPSRLPYSLGLSCRLNSGSRLVWIHSHKICMWTCGMFCLHISSSHHQWCALSVNGVSSLYGFTLIIDSTFAGSALSVLRGNLLDGYALSIAAEMNPSMRVSVSPKFIGDSVSIHQSASVDSSLSSGGPCLSIGGPD